jgi:hypothetical protein
LLKQGGVVVFFISFATHTTARRAVKASPCANPYEQDS